VSEGHNIEAAHALSEHHPSSDSPNRRTEVLEIIEVALLAIVAVATAWSGYQAAKWDGEQAFDYGTSSHLRVQADSAATLGGQQKLLDVSTFNTWIQAKQAGNEQLAALYVRRFSPEYKVAFDAWLKTDPFHDPSAPPGPAFMREYVNAKDVEGQRVNEEASVTFNEGTEARETADRYVRQTVLLATVLFLVAIAQRFKFRAVRTTAGVIALVLLVYAVSGIVTLPRI
jgi:hypothetical protein